MADGQVGRVRARSFGLILWGLGVAATASLLLAPLERLQPPTLHFSPLVFRLLAIVNPLLFISLAVPLGTWAAARVGLDAPLLRALIVREPAWPVLRRQIGPTLLVGMFCGLLLVGYAWLTTPWFAGTQAADFPMPIVTRALYGGVVEELMTRWGLMSLFAWVAWRLGGARRPVPQAALWTGIVLAALLFAAGHLPTLFAVAPGAGAPLVTAVLAGNAVPGFLFGWLFWRRGLEAAMIGHAATHLFAWLFLG